ncbi:MAG TPA: hypothetical protein VN841_01365 [Bryobacteraceae bacterium]|nr:hypothetical protein [Bryobacteraceae bacterium]
MQSLHYQRWNPPNSPVRIEFPHQLVGEIARDSRGETRGSLYGLLLGGEIRVLAARTEGDAAPARARKRDEQLVGLEKIGTFVRRARGEVFLAEPDLERFEGQRAAVALVIAGDRAGFFVRQADGSIQSIRSHEEFSLTAADGAPVTPQAAPARQATGAPANIAHPGPSAPSRSAPKPGAAQPATAAPRSESKALTWPRAATLCLAIPLAGLFYFRPPSPPPIELRLKPAGDTVAISWNPAAAARGGGLEIRDGAAGAKLDLRPGQSSLSYAPHGGRLEVRLTADSGDGPAQLDSAVLTLDEPRQPVAPRQSAAPSPDSSELRFEIAALEAQASELRESLGQGGERMARAQKIVDKLTHR